MNKLLAVLALSLPLMAQAAAYRTNEDGGRLTVNALKSGNTCQKVYLDFDGTSFKVVGNENRNTKTCQNMSDGQYQNGTLQVQVIGLGGEVNPWLKPTCDAVITIEGVEIGDTGTLTNTYCNKRSWNDRARLIYDGKYGILDLTYDQAHDQIDALDEKYGAFKNSGMPINYDVYTSSSDVSNTKKQCN